MYRHLLCSVIAILVVATCGRAQIPPRNCNSTGSACIEQCPPSSNSRYQWCGSCRYYIQCTDGSISYNQCPGSLVWDNSAKTCVSNSTTCKDCVIPVPICKSTGPNCITDCVGRPDYIHQYCGRCDYFIQCTGGATIYTPCQQSYLDYDDNFKACLGNSSTCKDNPCTIDLPGDYCSSNPCINGGTCQEQSDGYTCSCLPGYTGTNCNTITDNCLSSPCLNGGTCHNGINLWTCTCEPGYTGTNCGSIIDNCLSRPCLNGGTCNNDVDLWTCTCEPGYTGTACGSIIDNCLSSPCLNGGTCNNDINLWTCTCEPGYTGTNCGLIIDNCLSSPCLNGGTCNNDVNLWTCTCEPGYTGTNCGSIIDNCLSRPCLNGGTCNNDVDLWTCTCEPGYTGTNCGSIDACFSNPCLNGATCEADYVNGNYQCFCATDYTGTRCETYIGGCNPSPCMNGATCIPDGTGSSTCECPVQWTGRVCESPNYVINSSCGDIVWSGYPPKNGFTVFCYYTAPLSDVPARNKECRQVLTGLPIWNDAEGLMAADGNFGCIVSSNFPGDAEFTATLGCSDDYQQNVSLGNVTESAKLMVCIRYPYRGIPLRGQV